MTRHAKGKRFSRRHFVKLAASVGILSGCRVLRQPASGTTSTPTTTPTGGPGETPAAASTGTIRRPELVQLYPDVPSKVVWTHHAGVWGGEDPVPNAIRQMLDASIVELTGLNDAREAWAALFAPGERIAIKVNTIDASRFWTHVPLVMAIVESLQEAGVPAEQIVIFDRRASELAEAGYAINPDGPGVRCLGTGFDYAKGDWRLVDSAIRLSSILTSCDALINVPILKEHSLSGISFALKNHYGTFDRPGSYHDARAMRQGLAELNALPSIRDRTRLVVGDMLSIVGADSSNWSAAVSGDSILVSFDPVAHDTIGLRAFTEALTAGGPDPDATTARTTSWLTSAAEMGVGTNDPENIDLAEIDLG